MGIWRLVTREIRHRKLSFALGVFSVLVAVGVVVAALAMLDSHRLRTGQIVDEMETLKRDEMRLLEDDYRKIMKTLGFNVLILPKDWDPSRAKPPGQGLNFMPEEYVKRLAESKVVTVRHLLPVLEQWTHWPERDTWLTVVGTRGEVPLIHRDPKRPIAQPVKKGNLVLGYDVHRRLGLKVGDKVTFRKAELTVSQVRPEVDPNTDWSVWLNLAQAQEMLDKKGLINAIQALECRCAWANVEKVRDEIARILPETQVKPLASKALARKQARERAAEAHETAIRQMKQHRANLVRQRRDLVTWLVPVVVVGCAIWIGLLTFINVRQRRSEIGILRAIGLRSRHILLVFLTRAVLVGVLGALLGYVAGFALGALAGGAALDAAVAATLFQPWLLAVVLGVAPLLSALASWAPAIVAAQQDPAVVLSEE